MIRLFTFLFLVLAAQTSYADSCDRFQFGGIFKNAHGDKFEISSFRDRFEIRDLKLGDVYEAHAGHFTLQAHPNRTGHLLDLMGNSIPISIKLGECDGNSRAFYFRTTVPGQMAGGLKAPVIEAKIILEKFNEYSTPTSQNPVTVLGVYTQSIRAVESPRDSIIQKSLISGFNLAISIVEQYSNLNFRDYLEKTYE